MEKIALPYMAMPCSNSNRPSFATKIFIKILPQNWIFPIDREEEPKMGFDWYNNLRYDVHRFNMCNWHIYLKELATGHITLIDYISVNYIYISSFGETYVS